MATKKQIADLHATLTADVRKYIADMQAASKETRSTERSITDSMNKAARATKSLNDAQTMNITTSQRFNVNLRAAGSQMQSFTARLESGQGALQAFTAQGTQLLGVFGPYGAIAGAAVSIGMMTARMIGLGNETDHSTEKLKTYTEYVRELHREMEKIRFDKLPAIQQQQELAEGVAQKLGELRGLWDKLNTVMAAPRALRYDESLPNAPTQEELDSKLFRQGAVDETLTKIRKAQTELQALMQRHNEATGEVTKEAAADADNRLKNLRDEAKSLEDTFNQLLETRRQANNEYEKERAAVDSLSEKYLQAADPLRRYQQDLAALREAFAKSPSMTIVEAIEQVEKALAEAAVKNDEFFLGLDQQSKANFNEFATRTKAFRDAMNGMFQDVSNRAGDAFAEMVLTGENAFDSLVDMVARSVIRIAAQMAIINPILNTLFGGFGGYVPLPSFWGGAAAPVAGARAAGGPVDAGRTYLVGEEGPELFTPGASGSITNNGQLRAMSLTNGGNTYNIDARGADAGAVERIEQALYALAGPGVTERRSLSAYTNARRRGGLTFA